MKFWSSEGFLFFSVLTAQFPLEAIFSLIRESPAWSSNFRVLFLIYPYGCLSCSQQTFFFLLGFVFVFLAVCMFNFCLINVCHPFLQIPRKKSKESIGTSSPRHMPQSHVSILAIFRRFALCLVCFELLFRDGKFYNPPRLTRVQQNQVCLERTKPNLLGKKRKHLNVLWRTMKTASCYDVKMLYLTAIKNFHIQ